MKILLLGATGRLGSSLYDCWKSAFNVFAPNHSELDVNDFAAVRSAIASIRPRWIINCTGLISPEVCEEQPDRAHHLNTELPAFLATNASMYKSILMHFSTDYVFDGYSSSLYGETDLVSPVSVYGKTKYAGEQAILRETTPYVFRVSWLFGCKKPTFPDQLIQALKEKRDFYVATDKFSVPTYTRDVAAWLRPIVAGDLHVPAGLYHLCNSGSCSWQTYAQKTLEFAGLTNLQNYVHFCPLSQVPSLKVPRPLNSAMNNTKFATASRQTMRPWSQALAEYLHLRLERNRI